MGGIRHFLCLSLSGMEAKVRTDATRREPHRLTSLRQYELDQVRRVLSQPARFWPRDTPCHAGKVARMRGGFNRGGGVPAPCPHTQHVVTAPQPNKTRLQPTTSTPQLKLKGLWRAQTPVNPYLSPLQRAALSP